MAIFTKVLRRAARRFRSDERGAVTVDWVVLTAAIVGMGIMVFNIITTAIFEDAGVRIAEAITTSLD